eukprot:SAG11_NODE_5144_length_1651_cov_1.095361_1_plen_45_part_10
MPQIVIFVLICLHPIFLIRMRATVGTQFQLYVRKSYSCRAVAICK